LYELAHWLKQCGMRVMPLLPLSRADALKMILGIAAPGGGDEGIELMLRERDGYEMNGVMQANHSHCIP